MLSWQEWCFLSSWCFSTYIHLGYGYCHKGIPLATYVHTCSWCPETRVLQYENRYVKYPPLSPFLASFLSGLEKRALQSLFCLRCWCCDCCGPFSECWRWFILHSLDLLVLWPKTVLMWELTVETLFDILYCRLQNQSFLVSMLCKNSNSNFFTSPCNTYRPLMDSPKGEFTQGGKSCSENEGKYNFSLTNKVLLRIFGFS